ncbi:MAG: UDP-N-acetylmuramoyl-L-alanyl-D-glutamate--2,6-diaminopimelate ligase [Methanosarcinales archaeon]|nr:UDP-N-acetylmuramoyl-L-alanyl-D-glutamate--2,6-diaminopimelate ligase [Methanosarcinales archaeon]
MKKLKDILYNTNIIETKGSTDINIASLHLNSLEVKANSLFVAVKGFSTDGHKYIPSAISNGAKVIVCQQMPIILLDNITYIVVKDSSKALAIIASNFFDNPSSNLILVAVTGTNGKTSVVTLLYKLYTKLGYKVGLLSTVENKIGTETIPATHTTPNAIVLNKLLAKMVDKSCDYAFIEASSHAIHQNRTYALDLDGAIFTNLTHEHLDYHKTFREYLNAKKILFDNLPKHAFSLMNADEKHGVIMQQNTKAKKYSYALKSDANFTIRILETDFSGMFVNIDGTEIHTKLIGNFNAYNLLSVYATAMLLDSDKMEVLIALSTLEGAEGRFEHFVSEKSKIVAIVDYAHTPDALKNVLETINNIKKGKEKIITVVGAGGDRDKTKRPLMAAIASKLSDKVILTSDNPRTENPETIIKEMQEGVSVSNKRKVLAITDRVEAIKTACMLANEKDIILIAGKGHEKYQEINGIKYDFDDMAKTLDLFNKLKL